MFPGVTVLFCVPCCVCGGAADGLAVSGTGVLVGSGVGDGSGVGVGSNVAVGAGDALEVILEVGSESWMSPRSFLRTRDSADGAENDPEGRQQADSCCLIEPFYTVGLQKPDGQGNRPKGYHKDPEPNRMCGFERSDVE